LLCGGQTDFSGAFHLPLGDHLHGFDATDNKVVPVNPAASVRGPAHSARHGKTPVLDAAEARKLLNSNDGSTPAGLRDRALIALMRSRAWVITYRFTTEAREYASRPSRSLSVRLLSRRRHIVINYEDKNSIARIYTTSVDVAVHRLRHTATAFTKRKERFRAR
jgi:hypothetical protein